MRLILIPLLAQHRTSREYNNVNVYNYFFYRLYCWSAQWKNDVAPPEFKAFAIVSAVMVGHAILFVQWVELIFGFRIIALLPKYSVYVAVIVFAVPNYFILLYRNRYKKIISNFAPEPPQLRRRREGPFGFKFT